jgi:hypothetical protein
MVTKDVINWPDLLPPETATLLKGTYTRKVYILYIFIYSLFAGSFHCSPELRNLRCSEYVFVCVYICFYIHMYTCRPLTASAPP